MRQENEKPSGPERKTAVKHVDNRAKRGPSYIVVKSFDLC